MTDTPRLVRLVDDDEDLRLAQVQTLRIAGFAVEPFASAAEALEGLPEGPALEALRLSIPYAVERSR